MKITVQITIQSDEGQGAVFQQVACLERGALRPDTLGLSLAEARSILAGLEQTMAESQATEFVAQAQRCPRCGRQRACKGHHQIVFRTPFGKLSLDSPQLYRCACEPPGPKTFSPLAELLPERTSPELAYLETKFPALVSYGLTVKLLKEVLPIAENLNTAAIQMQVHRTAQRLEAERGEGHDAGVRDGNALLEPSAPWIVGLDGAYVHAKGQPSRTEGWFEVIVGKSLPSQDQTPKCFGFVSRYDPEPERRFSAWLDGQGLQSNQSVTFLSDGGDTVRNLPMGLHPKSEHLLDWFHVSMRLTGMSRLGTGMQAEGYPELGVDLEEMLEHLKWNLWHGKVDRALEITDELIYALDLENGSPEHRKLLKAVRTFEGYIMANPNLAPKGQKSSEVF